MKIFKKIFCLAAVLCLSASLLLLTACKDDETVCEEHIDMNGDKICDTCEADLSVDCTEHKDDDGNGLCDVCDKKYNKPAQNVSFTMTIRDEIGSPLSGITFTLTNDGKTAFTAVSNSSGSVSGTVKEGEYLLSVEGLPLYWASDASSTFLNITENNKSFSFTAHDYTPDGSIENPYPSENAETGEETTVSIPAGKTVHFTFKGAARYLVIKNSSASVTYEGNSYAAEGGEVKVELKATESYDAKTFAVKNNSSEAITVTITFESIPGTMDAPFEAALDTPYTANVIKGSTVYYTWTATESGTLTASSQDTNNMISFYNSSTYATSDSSLGEASISFNVSEGDVIRIAVESKNNTEPADEIIFTLSFLEN